MITLKPDRYFTIAQWVNGNKVRRDDFSDWRLNSTKESKRKTIPEKTRVKFNITMYVAKKKFIVICIHLNNLKKHKIVKWKISAQPAENRAIWK